VGFSVLGSFITMNRESENSKVKFSNIEENEPDFCNEKIFDECLNEVFQEILWR
jgi:hypothetical protein